MRGMTVMANTTHVLADDGRIIDVEQALAAIEKGQQLAGHFPSAEDMDRARRILTGELSPDAARAELAVVFQHLIDEETAAIHGR